MNLSDFIQGFIFEEGSARGEFVQLRETYQTIIQQHAYPPAIRQLLGQALVVATLLSAIIKSVGRLSIQFQSRGALKLLLAQCNERKEVRGIAKWQGYVDEAELMASLKDGILVVTMDLPGNEKPYQGIVAWRGNSLAESVEAYFKESEQLPTRLWLAVNEDSAAGFLLQMLPSKKTKEESVSQATYFDHLLCLTETISDEELLTLPAETVLHRLYSQEALSVFEPHLVQFCCACSVDRSENAILLLDREEIEEELRDKQELVVTCDFCQQEFHFDRHAIARILGERH